MIGRSRVAFLVALAGLAALSAPALRRRIGPSDLAPRPAADPRDVQPARPTLPVSLRDGASRDLSRPSGRILVVHFWATWCAPCEEELPGLLAWSGGVRDASDVEVLAVSVDESWEKVDGWLKKRGAEGLPLALDPKGATARIFGTVKFPETWFLSPDGTVLAHWVGPRDWKSRETLAELSALRKGTPPPS